MSEQEQEMQDLMGVLELTLGGEVRTVPKRSIWGLERFRTEAARAFGPIPGMLVKLQRDFPSALSEAEKRRLSEADLAALEEKNAQARVCAFADVRESVTLNEWHLDPVALLKSWTPGQLRVFLEARNRRVEREREMMEAARGDE